MSASNRHGQMISVFLFLILFCALAVQATAATITVSGDGTKDYTTIQAGIDAASTGDTVLVYDGVYSATGNKELDYAGKAITVKSVNGAGSTTIDCEDDGKVVLFEDDEGRSSVLEGFTITGGYSQGAAVVIDHASPTIRACIFIANEATNSAGALSAGYSNALISSCTFTGNTGTNGGAMALDYGNCVVENCLIDGNTATSGGGMSLPRSAAVFTNCVITNNTAGNHGGGVYHDRAMGQSPTFVNCIIAGNCAAGRDGGGIFAWSLYGTTSALLELVNCTIADNEANRRAGALHFGFSEVSVTNCIIWGNTATQYPDGPQVTGGMNLTYCDVQTGYTGTGNINADPQFINSASGDYHLASNSPCIDAGSNEAVIGTEDLDGNDRIVGNNVDMGCYEYPVAPNGNLPILENFGSQPDWTTTYDASWGSAASWSIVSGGESGDCMQVSRSSAGSSARVRVYSVPTSTNVDVSIFIKCPSSSDNYWAEFAYRLGEYSAQDFDSNPSNWTMVKKFSNSGTNGNGNTWTEYVVENIGTGTNTKISIGYKLGTTSGSGPTVSFDTFSISEYVAPTPTATPTPTVTATPTHTPTPTPTFPDPIVDEGFESMPDWDYSHDAPWGSAAAWSIVSGGQSGNYLQADRSSGGSSAKVEVYSVPQNTDIVVSCYMRCPSDTDTYWAEFACRLGTHSAEDFDQNPGNWTMIQKFSNTGTNGNGDTWTLYSTTVSTGSNTTISIGFKLGSSGGDGPVVGWDSLVIEEEEYQAMLSRDTRQRVVWSVHVPAVTTGSAIFPYR